MNAVYTIMDPITGKKVRQLARLLDHAPFYEAGELKIISCLASFLLNCHCGQSSTTEIEFCFTLEQKSTCSHYFRACDECYGYFRELISPLANSREDVFCFIRGSLFMLTAQDMGAIVRWACLRCDCLVGGGSGVLCDNCWRTVDTASFVSARTKVSTWAGYIQRADLLNKDILCTVCMVYVSLRSPLLDLSAEILKPFLVR